MKKTVSKQEFVDAFKAYGREDDFKPETLRAMFDWFEANEEGTGEEMELDVIEICCDWSESTIAEALYYYGLETLEELTDRTIVLFVDGLEDWGNYNPGVDGDKEIAYIAF